MSNNTFRKTIYRLSFAIAAFCILLNTCNLHAQSTSKRWVGTWSCAPYAAGTNTPPSPYLANNTFRQIVRVSIGGDTLRVKFSNKTCSTPVTLKSVNIAVSAGSSTIDATTMKQLKFGGNASVTMDAYGSATSDPIAFPLTPNMRLAITIYYGQCQTSADMTHHYGSRTDSYILTDDQTASADFSGSTVVERWYTINTIDVLAPDTAAAVAILGNSITDGYGLHGGLQNRWTDMFSQALLKDTVTSDVGVLNLGIGATTVAGTGATTGESRFSQDILGQSGVRWLIIFYGVNDIGGGSAASTIIDAYKKMIASAHSKNIRVYGATITPFGGNSYFTDAHEAVRGQVNNWIRTPGNFDAYIDFDKTIRDPADTTRLLAAYSNDWLHPNADGYKLLGESINVKMFTGSDTIYVIKEKLGTESHWFEAECATVGSKFNKVSDGTASNGKYVTVQAGLNSTASAPTDAASAVVVPFSVSKDSTYHIYARVNCPTANDDSFWVKLDNGSFIMANGLTTSGWQWLELTSSALTAGDHTLTIAYREDGAKLDKLCITSYYSTPLDMGDDASNCVVPQNQPPVANAGADQSVTDADNNGNESVTLNGSASTDSDGSIASYVWTESGNQIATGAAPSVSLAVGTHRIALLVTDDKGATATDSVIIKVIANTPPHANAGTDQSVTDTDNSGSETVTLDGSASSDPDGTIASYIWSEEGASIATGVKPSADFQVGKHIVVLTVTDNGNSISADTVIITVKAGPSGIGDIKSQQVFKLEQNYPNPFSTKTTITFEIPKAACVSLKIYNVLGKELMELAGKKYAAGKHSVEFEAGNLPKGTYFYKMEVEDFSVSQKMVIQNEETK